MLKWERRLYQERLRRPQSESEIYLIDNGKLLEPLEEGGNREQTEGNRKYGAMWAQTLS